MKYERNEITRSPKSDPCTKIKYVIYENDTVQIEKEMYGDYRNYWYIVRKNDKAVLCDRAGHSPHFINKLSQAKKLASRIFIDEEFSDNYWTEKLNLKWKESDGLMSPCIFNMDTAYENKKRYIK